MKTLASFGAATLCVAAFGTRPQEPGVITASEIRLVDAEGVPRLSLVSDHDGLAGLFLLDDEKRMRFALTCKTGTATAQFYDEGGAARVLIGEDAVMVLDEEQNKILHVGVPKAELPK